MTRRKLHVKRLQKIAAVRELQCVGAEVLAARASAHVAEKLAMERSAAEDRNSAEEAWQALHKEEAMPLELVALWAVKVQQESTNFERAADDARSAESTKEKYCRNLQAAQQREALAEGAQSEAMREYQRLREEIALQAAADLHLQNRVGR